MLLMSKCPSTCPVTLTMLQLGQWFVMTTLICGGPSCSTLPLGVLDGTRSFVNDDYHKKGENKRERERERERERGRRGGKHADRSQTGWVAAYLQSVVLFGSQYGVPDEMRL